MASTVEAEARPVPQHDLPRSEIEDIAPPPGSSVSLQNDEEEVLTPHSRASRILATLLLLLAAGWVGLCGYGLSQAWPGASLVAWLGWASTVAPPLILLALAWLIVARTSRRETLRFTKAVAAMRRESRLLEGVLAVVATRLEENKETLNQEASRLMTLGDEASDRLGRVTQYIAKEAAELERKAQALDQAAATAKVDIGALIADLPKAEEQARAVAEAMRTAGLGAYEQAASLEGQLAALTARGREADEIVGGAAQRLGAHIARIESTTGSAAGRIEQAAGQMNAMTERALTGAAESVDQLRTGLTAQSEALLAMVEQARAAFADAGAEAGRNLAERIEQAGAAIETLASRLVEQEGAVQRLHATLSERLSGLDAQLARLGSAGDEQSARLTVAIAGIREIAQSMQSELERGTAFSGELIGRSQEMTAALNDVSAQLRVELPTALAAIEAQAGEATARAENMVAAVNAVRDAAADAATMLAQGDTSLARQREALDALLERVLQVTAEASAQMQALDAAAAEADRTTTRMAEGSGRQLIDAMIQVRDAAQQAATHAREAIQSVIPETVATLTEASRIAIAGAVTEPVEDRLAELAGAAQGAMAIARQASERLTRQLLVMSETAAAIEDRIAEDQAKREQQASENLTRRVTLLIEALNSTAIDINKILSNEVADSAWAAYLKGDRGVFTRRAVRLLDSGEARAIQRHYEEEADFRDQVNRYVHDFESMLRRVLAEREGATLGVTLLSSDMGKLYVALSQGIEKLRRT
ncbi:MAG: hypothetical protein ACT4OE_02735 [Sphingosinicella sp.]